MRKHWKFGIRAIIFVVLLASLIIVTNIILTPKKYYDNMWPTTATYKGFYQMEKNSVDVLFLGSSHIVSGISPQVIYNENGIRSYNLGCEQQNMMVSYYWLKEALRFQTPKVVVLDAFMLFEYDHNEVLNTEEARIRMAMDSMKWSGVKWEAVNEICEADNSQSVNSFLFKNVRFHTRWKELSEQDFSFADYEKHYELKGFAAFSNRGKTSNSYFEPYSEFDTEKYATAHELMYDYFEKIVSLCRDENIELLLIKTPTNQWNVAKHNTVSKLAMENNLQFVDFNLQEVYDEAAFCYSEDMHDDAHSNIWGAKKLSEYLAQRIQSLYAVNGVPNSKQWEDTREYYDRVYSDCCLRYITDLNDYIDAINEDRYTILVATCYDMSYFADDEVKNAFSKIGLDIDSEQYDSYYAAITDKGIVQKSGPEKLSYSDSTRDNMVDFSIVSAGYNCGSTCSITIQGIEYSKRAIGINMVVYNEETRKVVDLISFDGEIKR